MQSSSLGDKTAAAASGAAAANEAAFLRLFSRENVVESCAQELRRFRRVFQLASFADLEVVKFYCKALGQPSLVSRFISLCLFDLFDCQTT